MRLLLAVIEISWQIQDLQYNGTCARFLDIAFAQVSSPGLKSARLDLVGSISRN